MAELTLETLARRMEALEKKLEDHVETCRVIPPRRDWEGVVGMFKDPEFQKQIDAEGRSVREAEPYEPADEGPTP
ncbi:MAG: hypothetical protein K2X87_22350 [Gemmataceae bacterium]|nr:hypothetical protein [Gemmataceae bacterium]